MRIQLRQTLLERAQLSFKKWNNCLRVTKQCGFKFITKVKVLVKFSLNLNICLRCIVRMRKRESNTVQVIIVEILE